MMLGVWCGADSNVFGRRTNVFQRLKFARNAIRAEQLVPTLLFVGITELWDASIDLWHAMFGGNPHPAEYQNIRANTYAKNVSETPRREQHLMRFRLRYVNPWEGGLATSKPFFLFFL
jgi:hypothetical protein